MSDSITASGSEHERGWKRRGLFAAAAALVAAVVGRVTEQPVEAGVDGDVVLGADNNATLTTRITATNADGIGFVGLVMQERRAGASFGGEPIWRHRCHERYERKRKRGSSWHRQFGKRLRSVGAK